MINEVLPIDGWKACGIDFNSKGCIVKYKHVDMSYLRCPCCGDHDLTIHRRYTVRVRDLPLGIHHTTLEIEVLECWCDKCQRFHTIKPQELHSTMGMTWRLMWHITWPVKEGSAADVARTLSISESTAHAAKAQPEKRQSSLYRAILVFRTEYREGGGERPLPHHRYGHKIYTPELDTIKKLGGNIDDHFEEMLNPTPSRDIVARVQELSKTYFEDCSKVVDENGEPPVV